MELLGQNKIDHHQRQVVILSQDSFYKVLTPEQKAKAGKGQFNFDHPGMCTSLELLYGRCVYYNRVISAACFLIASLRLFSVLALAHPLFGAWSSSHDHFKSKIKSNQIMYLDYQTYAAGTNVSLQAHLANKTEFSTVELNFSCFPQMRLTTIWCCKHFKTSCRERLSRSQFMILLLIPGKHPWNRHTLSSPVVPNPFIMFPPLCDDLYMEPSG